MKITRTSNYSGVTRTLEIPVTQAQLDAWENGALIQDAMPGLDNDEREFIKTGITAAEWDEMFPPEDHVEDDMGLPL